VIKKIKDEKAVEEVSEEVWKYRGKKLLDSRILDSRIG